MRKILYFLLLIGISNFAKAQSNLLNGNYAIEESYAKKNDITGQTVLNISNGKADFPIGYAMTYIYTKIKRKDANTYSLYLDLVDSNIGIKLNQYSKKIPVAFLKYDKGLLKFQ